MAKQVGGCDREIFMCVYWLLGESGKRRKHAAILSNIALTGQIL